MPGRHTFKSISVFKRDAIRYPRPMAVDLCMIVMLLSYGCNHDNSPNTKELDRDVWNVSTCSFSITHYPGYTLSDKRVVAGLVVTVRPDGWCVRASSDDTIGLTYEKGMLKAETLHEAARLLKAIADMPRPEEVLLMIDAPSERVCLCSDQDPIEILESQPWNPESPHAKLRALVMNAELADVTTFSNVPEVDLWLGVRFDRPCHELVDFP